MEGFFPVHRHIYEQTMSYPEALRLYVYLCSKASWRCQSVTFNKQLVVLEQGDLIFGRRACSEETQLSDRKIRTALSFLIECGFLVKNKEKSTNKYSFYSLPCVQQYHQNASSKRPAERPATDVDNTGLDRNQSPANDQQNDQQTTSKRPHKNNINTLILNTEDNIYPQNLPNKLKKIQIEQVVSHYNSVTGKNIKPDSKVNQELLQKSLKKYSVDDHKLVIDYIDATWSPDFKRKHFTLATIFGPQKIVMNLSKAEDWKETHQPSEQEVLSNEARSWDEWGDDSCIVKN